MNFDSLKTWYSGLSEREQKLLLVGALLGIVGVFYFTVYAPLTASLVQTKLALESERSDLVWVQEQAARASILRQSAAQTVFSGSLTQLVNQTTRSAGIPVSRMQPQGEELQVWIDEVAFNDLVIWLNTLEKRGIVIVQSDLTEVDEQGYVQVRRLQLGKA